MNTSILPYTQLATPPPASFPAHERIAAYWLLVSAYEHVNRTSLGDPDRDEKLKAISEARWRVLAEFHPGLAFELTSDVDRHAAIADRRNYLLFLETKAGAR